MDNIRVTGDAAYREELTSYIDESQFKSAFEHRYSRGWQRKLGAVLDVPETTVNGWFKSGRFPPLVKVAFGVLLSRDIRPHRNWIPVKNGDGYAVCATHGPVGRIVADSITRLEDAMLLAAAPQLYEASGDAFVVFDDARDFMDGWGDLADKLRAGLGAATGGDSADADDELQEEDAMKQTLAKFDNLDRDLVLHEIQKHYAVKLQQVGGRSKWLKEESGRSWWVLGGRENERGKYWHGIPEEMMEDETRAQDDGMLVIAEKHLTSIEAFAGPLGRLVSARDTLYRARQTSGDYQFTVKANGPRMQCDQAPNVVLSSFATIPCSAEDRERARARNAFLKAVAAMSPEDQAALLNELGQQ